MDDVAIALSLALYLARTSLSIFSKACLPLLPGSATHMPAPHPPPMLPARSALINPSRMLITSSAAACAAVRERGGYKLSESRRRVDVKRSREVRGLVGSRGGPLYTACLASCLEMDPCLGSRHGKLQDDLPIARPGIS